MTPPLVRLADRSPEAPDGSGKCPQLIHRMRTPDHRKSLKFLGFPMSRRLLVEKGSRALRLVGGSD